jgi:hypothetical protein
VADNKLAGIEMTYTSYSEEYSTVRIENAFVIGNSENAEGIPKNFQGIILAQTDGMLVKDVTFTEIADN